jgi:hypothetical protein
MQQQETLTRPDPDLVQDLLQSGFFDADWYRTTYQDVEMLGMDPDAHFLRYGRLLRRSPGPEFDTDFYLDTYTDAEESLANPLLHFIQSPDRSRRHTRRDSLVAQMAELRRSTEAAWLAEGASEEERPVISYCIPLKGRMEDITSTLQFNLAENARFAGQVEFIIVAFGGEQDLLDWVHAHFPKDLASGYLRIISDFETLDSWHFGKAKNAFRPHLHGEIYSSLDADNFVTAAETEMLLGLAAAYPMGFVFHHFSGHWGDGTSGRISMPASIYRHVGYDPKLLPRQFDEMDLILGALTEFPALPFIGVHEDRHVFALPGTAMTYLKQEQLPNRKFFVGDVAHRLAPLNPKGLHYTEAEPHLRDMGNFNAALSACRRSWSSARKAQYADRLMGCKHRLIESLPSNQMMDTLFEQQDLSGFTPPAATDICVLACVHDEDDFLPEFVTHHRRLGVTHFLFVDDHSSRPVGTLPLGENVLALRPKVGDFQSSKTLWLEGLMKVMVPEGAWVCTLDADELLHVPEGFADLPALTRDLEAAGADFAACLLIDMLPDPDTPDNLLSNVEQDHVLIFDRFCDLKAPAPESYRDHHAIRWGFGPHADLSFRFDARHHAFGTFDSLRKLSLFRYLPTRHLNQGFHTFHHLDGTKPPGPGLWTTQPILPISHYKLVRLFSEAMRAKMLEKSAGYHARSGQNIDRIFSEDFATALDRIRQLAPYLRPGYDLLQRDVFRPSPPDQAQPP